jgi:hypothetical protein
MKVGDIIKAHGIGLGIIIHVHDDEKVTVYWTRKGAFAPLNNTSKEAIKWLEPISTIEKES